LPSFSVIEPTGPETPVIVEVPHAGLHVDAESLAYSCAPARSIGQDADLYVSELFENAPTLGASFIYSGLSRYVCDLNRSETDLDSHTTAHGTSSSSPHGVVWRKTTEGRPALIAPLPASEVERRLDLIYRPYHRALYKLIEQKREKFGFVILLAGHSMPSFGRLGERRADVVPGSRGRTSTDVEVLKTADRVCGELDYDVAHDAPYRGGFTTQHYGSPHAHVHAMQIELARRIYMDENNLARIPDRFQQCQNFCDALVAALGQLKLA